MTRPSDTATVRTPSRRPLALALGAALLLVLGLALGTRIGGDRQPPAAASSDGAAPVAAPAAQLSDAPPAPTGPASAGPGTDPTSAVEGYLTAEATGALELAFTYLVPEEQDAFGTAAAYVAAHADLLGTVTGFVVSDVVPSPDDPSRATVTATVGFRPTLDPVSGLVPAKAAVSFPVAASAGAWSVSLAGATFEPILPGDDRAGEDARLFVEAAVACELPAGAYGGEIVGQPALVAALCGASGDVTVTEVGPLDDPLTVQPFLSAFGPDVGTWARVATVTSPEPFRLVLAPHGDAWTVIGALPPQT